MDIYIVHGLKIFQRRSSRVWNTVSLRYSPVNPSRPQPDANTSAVTWDVAVVQRDSAQVRRDTQVEAPPLSLGSELTDAQGQHRLLLVHLPGQLQQHLNASHTHKHTLLSHQTYKHIHGYKSDLRPEEQTNLFDFKLKVQVGEFLQS